MSRGPADLRAKPGVGLLLRTTGCILATGLRCCAGALVSDTTGEGRAAPLIDLETVKRPGR